MWQKLSKPNNPFKLLMYYPPKSTYLINEFNWVNPFIIHLNGLNWVIYRVLNGLSIG